MIKFMDSRDRATFVPRTDDEFARTHSKKTNFLSLTSSYWSRNTDRLPQLYKDEPWTMHQDYIADGKMLAKMNDQFDKQYLEFILDSSVVSMNGAATAATKDIEDEGIIASCLGLVS